MAKEPGKGIYSESVGDVHICKEAVPLDKIKKRDMKLSDYNISRAKYNELKYFCMQYAEKKRELEKGYGLKVLGMSIFARRRYHWTR